MSDAKQTAERPEGVRVVGPTQGRQGEILTPEALAFVAHLHRRFDAARQDLLRAREERQREWDAGSLPGFLAATRAIRDDPEWRVADIPDGLQDRRVEITGPVERKMMINALNSGARVFMADFEDSHSPTWENTIAGQLNLLDHSMGRLTHRDEARGKDYRVAANPATLVVRVRGLHLDEAHLRVDEVGVSGALFDLGLHLWHNAKRLPAIGLGPWYYLPKIEHHLEARWWNDVCNEAERVLGLDAGEIKVTCLVETFPAVFQMEEILHELRERVVGLNAGRWDYIFSCIKVTRNHADKVLPDRGQITMDVPFMRAYARLLVNTCHKRGCFAMGGMSAFIPDRRDEEVTRAALAAVRADKRREAADGCDGTWVAHPDLVPIAMEVFDAALGPERNQLQRRQGDVRVTEAELQDLTVPGGKATRAGLVNNLEVALRYLTAWLGGVGAVAIHNLMEDAATAEISRSQVWQWVKNGTRLDDGEVVTRELASTLITELVATLEAELPPAQLQTAASILRAVALADEPPPFLTLPAYDHLRKETRA